MCTFRHFPSQRHDAMLGRPVDVLPYILLPLAGPEEFTEEEMEGDLEGKESSKKLENFLFYTSGYVISLLAFLYMLKECLMICNICHRRSGAIHPPPCASLPWRLSCRCSLIFKPRIPSLYLHGHLLLSMPCI